MSPFTHASRALKECRTALKYKLVDKVYVAALHDEGLLEFEEPEQGIEVRRIRLVSRAWSKCLLVQLIKFVEWNLRVFGKYARFKLEFVHCHSLSTLPVGVLFKLIRRVKLVYDAHELETEVIPGRNVRKLLEKIAERMLIRFADAVLVVNDSIAEWYRDHYRLNNLHVLINTPERAARPNSKTTPKLRDHFSLGRDDRIYLYQGGIAPERGIETILEAFAEAPPNLHLVCMGYGELVGLVREYEARHSNIHYHPAVSPTLLPNFTESADIGIHFYEHTSLNNYYSLSNKIFEYAAAGLPMIVNGLPEIRKIVEGYDCGIVVERYSSKALLEAITGICRMNLSALGANARKIIHDYNWEAQEPSLLQAYSVR